MRDAIRWAATAPLAIVLVLDPAHPVDGAFDEGRVTERLMIGAQLLGLGAGTAWFGNEEQQAAAKRLLGVPADRTMRSMVAIGHPDPAVDRVTGRGGRKPLADLVSFERMNRDRST